jgi:hypothetical protein
MGTEFVSSSVNWSGREAKLPKPYEVELKTGWSFISTSHTPAYRISYLSTRDNTETVVVTAQNVVFVQDHHRGFVCLSNVVLFPQYVDVKENDVMYIYIFIERVENAFAFLLCFITITKRYTM